MENRLRSEAYRTTTVCVDENRGGVPCGRIYNGFLEEGRSFGCLTEFLQEMERILSQVDFPKSFTAPRTFAPLTGGSAPLPVAEPRNGKQATFAVRVLFRQNATWQGSVTWLEGKQEQGFRSALELIFLMSSALGIQTAS